MKKKFIIALLCSALLVSCQNTTTVDDTSELGTSEAPNTMNTLSVTGINGEHVEKLLNSRGTDLMKQVLTDEILTSFCSYGSNPRQKSSHYDTGKLVYYATNDEYETLEYTLDGDSIRICAYDFNEPEEAEALRDWFKKTYVALFGSEAGLDCFTDETPVEYSCPFTVHGEEYQLSFVFLEGSITIELKPYEATEYLGIETGILGVVDTLYTTSEAIQETVRENLKAICTMEDKLVLTNHYYCAQYNTNVFTGFHMKSDHDISIARNLEYLVVESEKSYNKKRFVMLLDDTLAKFWLHCDSSEELEVINSKVEELDVSTMYDNSLYGEMTFDKPPFPIG